MAQAALPPPAAPRRRIDLVYPLASTGPDTRNDLPIALLKLAMEETGTPYTVRATSEVVEQSRAIADMEAGREINILWIGQSRDLEERLRPVRIPLSRGLLGLRVLLIRRDRQPEFNAVHTVADLAPLTGGQAIGWPDVAILRAAGLTISTNRYDLLFRQLAARHIDYFPRAVTEVESELTNRGAEMAPLAIERHLLLAYPFDMFFFTRKDDEDLAALIERGLNLAYADGRYMAVFNGFPDVIRARQLLGSGQRDRLLLSNPDFTAKDKAIPARYWMDELVNF